MERPDWSQSRTLTSTHAKMHGRGQGSARVCPTTYMTNVYTASLSGC